MNNIILTGMPAAGKSTIGKPLAQKAGFVFVDTDHLIEKGEGKTLSKIIEESSLEKFKEIEEKYALSVSGENQIISTGGSVIYSEKSMEHLSTIGKIVYLSLDLEALEKRIMCLTERGVVIEKGKTFKDLYDERTALYRKFSDITLNCNNKSVDEIVSEIASKIAM